MEQPFSRLVSYYTLFVTWPRVCSADIVSRIDYAPYYMIAVLCSADGFLQDKIAQACSRAGFRVLRTAKLDRLVYELKQPNRIAIVDVALEAIQERGALRTLVNLARITDNAVLCICPNQDEDLKKLARQARPTEVFLRYDLHTRFVEHLTSYAVQVKARSNQG